MLRAAAKLLRVMNSETEPGQISLAFCLAMLAGFTPLLSVHNLPVLLLVMFLRVNVSGFILGLGVFSGASYLLDPLFHLVGLRALTAAPLEGLWTSMYNSTFWRLERFNNTVVMGSLLVSIALFVPLYAASNLLIRRYREHVLQWVRRTRVMQFIKGTKFYRIYRSVSEFREGL
jgi:uncharacterized protein (TIGR03546 family)